MWAVFGHQNEPQIAAIAEGLRSLGFSVRFVPRGHWKPGEFEPWCKGVVTYGAKHPAFLDAHRAQGIPVIVVENGYLGRPDYWQLSLGDYNQFWPGHYDDRRMNWERYKVRETDDSKPIVIAGQKPRDAQHRLSPQELSQAYQDAMRFLQKRTSRPVVFREHPTQTTESLLPVKDLMERAHAIVTINSGIGHEAIQHGVPVVKIPIEGVVAPYDDLTNPLHVHPDSWSALTDGEQLSYMRRLTYSQYTVDEIRTFAVKDFLDAHSKPSLGPLSRALLEAMS